MDTDIKILIVDDFLSTSIQRNDGQDERLTVKDTAINV